MCVWYNYLYVCDEEKESYTSTERQREREREKSLAYRIENKTDPKFPDIVSH